MEKMGVMEPMEWMARMAQTELQVQLVRNYLLHSGKSIELFHLFPYDLRTSWNKWKRWTGWTRWPTGSGWTFRCVFNVSF
jgi:hypothetical protein